MNAIITYKSLATVDIN